MCVRLERCGGRHHAKRASHAQLHHKHAAVPSNERKLLAVTKDLVDAAAKQETVAPS